MTLLESETMSPGDRVRVMPSGGSWGRAFWVGNVLRRHTYRIYRVTVRGKDGTLRAVDLRRVRKISEGGQAT